MELNEKTQNDIGALVDWCVPPDWDQRGVRRYLTNAITQLCKEHGDAIRQDLIQKYSEQNHDIEQTLGRALGYPRYAEDTENFPEMDPNDPEVCVGDHVPETLADEAAKEITRLKELVAQKQPEECRCYMSEINDLFNNDPDWRRRIECLADIVKYHGLHEDSNDQQAIAGELLDYLIGLEDYHRDQANQVEGMSEPEPYSHSKSEQETAVELLNKLSTYFRWDPISRQYFVEFAIGKNQREIHRFCTEVIQFLTNLSKASESEGGE